VPSTGTIGAVKLLRVSGAYWRGDAKNKQLQRVYGISFPTQKEMEAFLKELEEREKRDHRRIGKEMKIFAFHEDIGMGLPLWLPNGEQLFHTLQEFMREVEEEAGYQYVRTPHIIKGKMLERTGHIPYYTASMYTPIEIEGEHYYLRPMNCPHHHAIYSELVQSYKQLPLRLAEAGTIYRYELSGTMYGIIRTRGFTQNDAHLYVTPEQVEDEVINVLQMNIDIYEKMGLKNYWFQLSLPDFEGHPEKYAGDKKRWEMAAEALRRAGKRIKKNVVEVMDEAAFYGPKIDIQTKNVKGKEESIATVQVDIMVPKRLGLTYIDEQDKPQIPVVIHRAIIGSYERFIAFLLEQTMGKFPLWLAPVQVKILPLSEKFRTYGEKVFLEMKKRGIRVELDSTDETLNYRIRN
ncbi:MAG: threonine--tRNA ligase, partial [archaeon]|nr:threonine--tRNA ligase [archaeon]